MNSTTPLSENPDRDDPLFLFSQSLDGPLAAETRARLDEALTESPALREQAAELAWVHDVIAANCGDLPEIDSPTFVDLATASAVSGDDADLAWVDRRLEAYRKEGPDVDSDAFVRSMLSLAAALPIRRAARPWRLRRYVPIAMAASVLLAVTGYMGYRSSPQGAARWTGRTIVTYDRLAVADASQTEIRSNVVAFAMSEPDRSGASAGWISQSDRVEIIVVGSDDGFGRSEPPPPL